MSKSIYSISQNTDIEQVKKDASKTGVDFKGKSINKYSVGLVKQDEEYTNTKMPDIYEFLADINNSDVKTPTWLANALLDLLPKSM
jgi:hypothetical protein